MPPFFTGARRAVVQNLFVLEQGMLVNSGIWAQNYPSNYGWYLQRPMSETMNRKVVYGLLAFPIICVLVVLAVLPAKTRETFLSEFSYRTKSMLGMDTDTYQPQDLGPTEQDLERELEAENTDAKDGALSTPDDGQPADNPPIVGDQSAQEDSPTGSAAAPAID